MVNFKEGIYDPPRVDGPAMVAPAAADSAPYFPVSITKLVLLNVASFGMYIIYWFFKNWQREASRTSEKIRPFWRAIFYVFFTPALFENIHRAAVNRQITVPWRHNVSAGVVIVLVIVSRILDRVSARSDDFGVVDLLSVILMAVMTVVFCRIQRTVNALNDDPEGQLNAQFSFWNFALLFVGGVVWVAILLAALDPIWLGEALGLDDEEF